ncbi:MAG: sigma-54 interaction domain-containing protein [Spongiibacteraceae bacterium]
MSNNLNVLLLCPAEQRVSLGLLLTSLGETVVDSTASNDGLDDCDAAFVMQPTTEQYGEIEKAAAAGLPLIVIGDSAWLESVAPSCRAEVFASLREQPDYRDVLEVLYRLHYCTRGAAKESPLSDELVGRSEAMQHLRQMVSSVADRSVTVLISGPSGSGKEVVARKLHQMSPRGRGPFVPVNCGAIPRELLESELFGHERGAFTGAISHRAGRFELAQGGTIFLDEIGDMPLDMQVKILRVIQERSFERVGSSKTQEADVRIMAATHRDLESMISDGEFREDLYYRLNVFPLAVPPLSERREDIPELVNLLLRDMRKEGRGDLRLARTALDSLCACDWPGNIRELANLLERLAIMYPVQTVGLRDLPEKYQSIDDDWQPPRLRVENTALNPQGFPAESMDLKQRLLDLERDWIEQALAEKNGVVTKAAAHLGLRRTTLIEKMRKLSLS